MLMALYNNRRNYGTLSGYDAPQAPQLDAGSQQMLTAEGINNRADQRNLSRQNLGLVGRGPSPQAFPNPNARTSGGATMAPTAPTPPATSYTGAPTSPGMANPYGNALSGYGAPAAPAAGGVQRPGMTAAQSARFDLSQNRFDAHEKEFDQRRMDTLRDKMAAMEEKGLDTGTAYTAMKKEHDDLVAKHASSSINPPAASADQAASNAGFGPGQFSSPAAPAQSRIPGVMGALLNPSIMNAPAPPTGPIPVGAPGHPRIDPNVTGHGNLTEAYATYLRSAQPMLAAGESSAKTDPGTLASAQTNLNQLSGGSATANNAAYVGQRMLGQAQAADPSLPQTAGANMAAIRQTENQRQQLVGQNQQTVNDVNARAQLRDPGQLDMTRKGIANAQARLQQFGRGNYDLSAPVPFMPPGMSGAEGSPTGPALATAANLGAPYAPTNYGPQPVAPMGGGPQVSAPAQRQAQATTQPAVASTQPATQPTTGPSNPAYEAKHQMYAGGRRPGTGPGKAAAQPAQANAQPATQPVASANRAPLKTATGPNGHQIVTYDGQTWVDARTGQPVQ